MARSVITLATSGPIDHIASSKEHALKARDHARLADQQARQSIPEQVAYFARMAELDLLPFGIREEYRQLSEAMATAAQRLAALGAKGAGL